MKRRRDKQAGVGDNTKKQKRMVSDLSDLSDLLNVFEEQETVTASILGEWHAKQHAAKKQAEKEDEKEAAG